MADESLILFKNESGEKVTIYFFRSWDKLCWISWFSKIIEPGQEFLQRGNYRFKYQLQLGRKDLKVVKSWSKDLYILIDNSGKVIEDDLDNHRLDKRVSLQHDDYVKSASKSGQKDLYVILGLDMKAVRKMTQRKQTEVIYKAFKKAMRVNHPDRPGDKCTNNFRLNTIRKARPFFVHQ